MFDNTFKDCALLSYYFGQDSNPFSFDYSYSENKDCTTNLKGLKLQKPFKQSLIMFLINICSNLLFGLARVRNPNRRFEQILIS